MPILGLSSLRTSSGVKFGEVTSTTTGETQMLKSVITIFVSPVVGGGTSPNFTPDDVLRDERPRVGIKLKIAS